MAALDSTIPQVFKGAAAIRISDGTGTPLTVDLIFEGTFSWTQVGRTVNEARSRGRRKSTPVLIEGEDNDMELTLSGKITTYLGNSNTHVREALTQTGTAGSWVKTGAGNAYSFDLKFTSLAGDGSGTTQVLTFSPCVVTSLQTNPDGDSGHEFEATITCYANRPTIA